MKKTTLKQQKDKKLQVTHRLHILLSTPLLEKLDRISRAKGGQSRNEVVREAIRQIKE